MADGWIDPAGPVLDLGCGLGAELGWLTFQQAGPLLVGVDRSLGALARLGAERPGVSAVAANVLALPFRAASFPAVLDRGCYHYLPATDRRRYGAEAARVVAPGGRLLLRACLTSVGERNDVDENEVVADLEGWRIVSPKRAELPSDMRSMLALVVRAEWPGPR